MFWIDLQETLTPLNKISFSVKWWYNINNYAINSGRSVYEYFEEEDNCLYVIAQFLPLMCVYNEVEGWQWIWMDEGLNTFTQSLAEAQWEKDYYPFPCRVSG